MPNPSATEETTYVLYFFPGEPEIGVPAEVANRDPKREAEFAPLTAYGFVYCNRDDTNQSKLYYIDGLVYDAKFVGHDILRRTIGSGNVAQLVHCRTGNWEPFDDEYAEAITSAA